MKKTIIFLLSVLLLASCLPSMRNKVDRDNVVKMDIALYSDTLHYALTESETDLFIDAWNKAAPVNSVDQTGSEATEVFVVSIQEKDHVNVLGCYGGRAHSLDTISTVRNNEFWMPSREFASNLWKTHAGVPLQYKVLAHRSGYYGMPQWWDKMRSEVTAYNLRMQKVLTHFGRKWVDVRGILLYDPTEGSIEHEWYKLADDSLWLASH